MRIIVITIFPELVESLLESGIPRKAVDLGKLKVSTLNPREFTEDARQTVDDRPYGGGPGMVMKPDPLKRAIDSAKACEPDARVVYLSPQGKCLQQQRVQAYARDAEPLILLTGRYEGVDERLIEAEIDEEISIGDYVLSGGELGAMVLIDAISRLIPNVLGHKDSAAQDSFSECLLDYPHYTRPECFNGRKVPDVLISGDHQAIARWRRQQALGRTWKRRPELLPDTLCDQDLQLLDEYRAGENTDCLG